MTTEIARFMLKLEEIWDEHLAASLRRHDLAGSLANLVAEPSLLHIPAMTGAAGRAALERYYRDDLFGHVPADMAVRRVSRKVTASAWSMRRPCHCISSQRVLWDHATLSAQLGLVRAEAPDSSPSHLPRE